MTIDNLLFFYCVCTSILQTSFKKSFLVILNIFIVMIQYYTHSLSIQTLNNTPFDSIFSLYKVASMFLFIYLPSPACTRVVWGSKVMTGLTAIPVSLKRGQITFCPNSALSIAFYFPPLHAHTFSFVDGKKSYLPFIPV